MFLLIAGLNSCATQKLASFKPQWEIQNIPGKPFKACVGQDDLDDLIDYMYRCDAK